MFTGKRVTEQRTRRFRRKYLRMRHAQRRIPLQRFKATLRVRFDPVIAWLIPRNIAAACLGQQHVARSEEHTSELQSLMRISYAVFCLKKKKTKEYNNQH